MKNKLIHFLVAGALACGIPFAAHAQTDVTDTYLKNPGFESGFDGWENVGMQTQTNASFSKKEGGTYVEQWVGQGNRVSDCHVSQTLTSLKNGRYKLTAAAQNIQQNSSDTQSGAYVFAGDEQVPVGAADDYSVEFTVIEGQAAVGFKAENATGNWISCDNFRLYSVNNDLAEIQAELQRRIDEAQELTSEKMQKDVLSELRAAIQAAQQEVGAATDENITGVAVRLREAVADAQSSIGAYRDLQAAIDEALEAYGDGSGDGAEEFDTAIKAAQAALEGLEAGVEDVALAVESLGKAVLAYELANASGTAPTVVTDTRYARGATVAFGRSTVTGVSASDILEQGFCWSTSPDPTILDDRTTEHLVNKGNIYCMKDLQPSTVYYVRAYAMTKGHAVGYGDVIKIITIPKGTINYTYDNGGPADANARIDQALASAVEHWNNLTSIRGLNIQCHYGANTPTADCSYGGWMRVGPNASYQRAGTIMHEMAHAIGVGTHDIWWSGDFRAEGDRGNWLGERANEVLRFWDNDNTAVMTGDNTHMWPYGINGAQEDNGTEVLYVANGLIVQALGEDGLPPTGGFSTPAYVFEQEDGVKYYLKNESKDLGLYTSYLVATPGSTSLKCEAMTAAEAATDDNAAWYVTFDPKTCYYRLRNAGTGQYMTYNTSRSTFLTADRETPTTAENFHFMRGRNDVNIGTDAGGIITRGYWIIHPDNTPDPSCLSVNARGRTVAPDFNPANSAEAQRWVFLTGEELQNLDAAVKEMRKSELEEMLAHVDSLAGTPHDEDAAGTDEALNAELTRIRQEADRTEATAEDIDTLTQDALAAAMDFLAEATPKSVDQPFDISFMMSDAGLKDGEGWSTKPTISFSCGEFYEKTFDFNQTVEDLPAGTYQFKGQGFQRPGAAADVYKAFTAGQDNVNAVIYAGDKEAKIQNIAAEAQVKKLGGNETAVGSNPTLYVPNNMQAASLYFAEGLYDNGVVTQLTEDGSRLKVGLRCRETAVSYWCIFDNFRLYYYGSMSPEHVTDVRPSVADKTQPGGLFDTPADIYGLSGIRIRRQATSLDGLPRGIYIVNGRKVIVR